MPMSGFSAEFAQQLAAMEAATQRQHGQASTAAEALAAQRVAQQARVAQAMRDAAQVARHVDGVLPYDVTVSTEHQTITRGWKLLYRVTSHDPDAGSRSMPTGMVYGVEGLMLTREGRLGAFQARGEETKELQVMQSRRLPADNPKSFHDMPPYVALRPETPLPDPIANLGIAIPGEGYRQGIDAIVTSLAQLMIRATQR